MTVDELVTQNMGLAAFIARQYRVPSVEYEDIQQAAFLGLVEASKTFDPDSYPDVKFSTHAAYWIKRRIFELIRMSELVPVKAHLGYKVRRISQAADELRTEDGRPDVRAIAQRMGIRPARVRDALSRPLGRKPMDDYPIDEKSEIEAGEWWEEFAAVWRSLTTLQRILVCGWLGMNGRLPRSCPAMAADLGIAHAEAKRELKAAIAAIGERMYGPLTRPVSICSGGTINKAPRSNRGKAS